MELKNWGVHLHGSNWFEPGRSEIKLSDKVAIITGAGRGIGREIALAFATQGSRLVIAARSIQEIESVQAEIEELGSKALAVPCDISNPEAVTSLFNQTQQFFGKLDILVNNAGVIKPIAPIEETDPKEWIETILTNLYGTYNCSRAAIPMMRQQGQGKIINMSGGGATSANPYFTAYSTSKAGIVRLTDTLASELLKDHIDVNAIAPGAVFTQITKDIIDAGEQAGERLQTEALQVQTSKTEASRVTGLAIFLASSESDGLTGRLISAIWDDWDSFTPERIKTIAKTDWYQLRRTVPPT